MMKTRLINQSIAFMLLITKLNQNVSRACKLRCVVHFDSLYVDEVKITCCFVHVE